MRKNIYYFSTVLAGILWGTTGLFSRELFAAGMTSANVSAVRVIGATMGFVIWNALTDREAFRIQWRHMPLLFCIGIVTKFGSTFFYAKSQQRCSLAVSAVLLYTAPAIVVLLSAILWKERLTKEKSLALILTLLGCVLVTGVFSGEQMLSPEGIAAGAAAGFTYALYTVLGHYALKDYSARTVTLWAFLFGSLGALCTLDIENAAVSLSAQGAVFYEIGIVIFCTLLPNFLYTLGLTHIESGRAAIIVSIEPAVASAIGILVFRESASLATFCGLICVIFSVYLLRK